MQVPKQIVHNFASNALAGIHQYMVLHAFVIDVHLEESPSKQHAFWYFHHPRQCTGKMILAHVILNTNNVHGPTGKSAHSTCKESSFIEKRQPKLLANANNPVHCCTTIQQAFPAQNIQQVCSYRV